MKKQTAVVNDAISLEVRRLNEIRGLMYFEMVQSAAKYGLDKETYARSAVRKLGNYNHAHYPDTDSVSEFVGAFLREQNIKQFRTELVSMTDEEAIVHFHYCPMYGAWYKLTDDPKEIELICDAAMDVDRGVFDDYEHLGFRLGSAIACGGEVCELHFLKK